MKERIGALFHAMPHKALPTVIAKRLVADVSTKLSFFTPKNGIEGCGPQAMLGEPKLVHEKHCETPLESHVQAPNEPNPHNTEAPRTLDCVFVSLRRTQCGTRSASHPNRKDHESQR